MHKLGKFVRLLASDKPGEVVAAAAAINRTLKADGHDIHALADAVERSSLADTPNDEKRSWRVVRQFCADHQQILSERERGFIADLARWRGQLTAKQLDWLHIIESNIRRRQAQ